MIGSYVLSFQVYLALPLQAAALRAGNETALVAGDIRGVRLDRGGRPVADHPMVRQTAGVRAAAWWSACWCWRRPSFRWPWYPTLTGSATAAAVAALLASVGAAGPRLGRGVPVRDGHRRGAVGAIGWWPPTTGSTTPSSAVGILLGNVATGSLIGAARAAGLAELVWLGLTAIGLVSAAALYVLMRDGGRLAPSAPVTASGP